jgi:hypothetical protein
MSLQRTDISQLPIGVCRTVHVTSRGSSAATTEKRTETQLSGVIPVQLWIGGASDQPIETRVAP